VHRPFSAVYHYFCCSFLGAPSTMRARVFLAFVVLMTSCTTRLSTAAGTSWLPFSLASSASFAGAGARDWAAGPQRGAGAAAAAGPHMH
jgi:hypothetical protein